MSTRLVSTLALPRPIAPRSTLRLPAGWPLYVLIIGYPLWWVVGVSELGWLVASLPMLAFLVTRDKIVAPRGFGLWALVLVWMLASATQLPGGTSWMTYAFRLSSYISATIMLLYVVNVPEERLPTRKLVFLLAGFWSVLTIFGVLGLLFAHVRFQSAMELAFPGLASYPYFYDLVHPQFAEIQHFIGYTIARPSAPFQYSNYWGANFGALVPMALAALLLTRSVLGRWLVALLLVVSIVPLIISVNRGVWLSLGIALTYALVRFVMKGHARAALVALLMLGVAIVLILTTPLGQTVADRLAHPDSDEGRLALIRYAFEGVEDSPILGHAVPERIHSRLYELPNVGTHGQIWQVLYTTGIPGFVFFLAWMLHLFWRSGRGRSPIRFWAHVSILIMAVEMLFYSFVPVALHLLFLIAAIAWREGRVTPPLRATEQKRTSANLVAVAPGR